ncbi:hypothetical protein FNYG_14840 [Fusarium nygamai]|uniref:Uncharacterized protein n=1 Tax=Gibberella nygamai TaxID=42673 RepID=A0A2K0UPK5_GIBNY|nr:hypothetical protein FNYG_14840 [Fusarium nygamai]
MKRWLATHEPAKASLFSCESQLPELGAAIGIDFDAISQQYWEVTRKKMLSRQENIVMRLNLPERCDAASGKFRTVWLEGVVREFMAVEFKRGETSAIDLTGVDDDDEGSLFVAQGGDLEAFEPDSQPQPPSEQGQHVQRQVQQQLQQQLQTQPQSQTQTQPRPQQQPHHTPPAPPPSPCPKTMNLLTALLKECEPINIEVARITWKCLQEAHGQSWASLISSLCDFQESAFEGSEHQRLGNHLGNILQYLHDELGSPPTSARAHPDVEMDTTQDTGDDPRLAEMMDRFAKMESQAQETEETQRKVLETAIGSLETVLG